MHGRMIEKLIFCNCLILMIHLALCGAVQSWGPATHSQIAATMLEDPRCPFHVRINPLYFYGGSMFVDFSLAIYYLTGEGEEAWITRQSMFHCVQYARNLVSLAETGEERAFAFGWCSHLISDEIESAYSLEKGLSADFPVDYLCWPPPPLSHFFRVVEELIVDAWELTYPNEIWSPTIADFLVAYTCYEGYLLLGGIWLIDEGYDELSEIFVDDYEEKLDESVEESFNILTDNARPASPNDSRVTSNDR